MPFVATTSLRKLVLLLLGCLGFVAVGVLIVRSPLQDCELESLVGGWLSITFFGFCGVVALVQIVGRRQRLKIDSYGITWTQRSDQTIPWSAITDVDILTVGRGQRFLTLWLVDPERFQPAKKPRRSGPSLATRLYGGDVHIPLSPLNTSFKDVLSAVDQYRPRRDR